jgi:hypothetical protein
MATLSSKQTSTQETALRVDAHGPRATGLWWLWLVSDQATIGTQRRSQASRQPGTDVARSWALADLALNQIDT